MEIDDAVAVVTGAASGIGRATALELARRGAHVVAADIHEDRLEELRTRIEGMGRRVLTVRCDVAYDDDVEHLRAEALEEMGHVDIVMSNAGIPAIGPPERMTMQDWDWVLQVNLYGVIRGVRAFLGHMLERGSGHVVNTASLAGLYAYGWHDMAYVTSKFGVVGFTEALALYVRPHGVGVTLICPGPVETNIAENFRAMGVDDATDWLRLAEMPPAAAPDLVAQRACDAVVDGQFLVLTAEEVIRERMRARGADYDAFVAEMVSRLPASPNLHRG
jgi:NAD(P)-dependent dehydrogenase (short-subunit alcohol dehydrogenase family)